MAWKIYKNDDGRDYPNFWYAAIVFIFAALVWSPVLGAPFMNDDFQILLYHSPESLAECFHPFVHVGVTDVYWRPLPNFLHSATMYFFGFDAFWFRLGNLLLLAAGSLLFYIFLQKLGVHKIAALFSSLLFAAVPSRGLIAGWIAVRGDILALIFILLAAVFYLNFRYKNQNKYIVLALTSYLMAVLSKEISYAAAALPLITEIIIENNKSLKKALLASASAVTVIIFSLILRLAATGVFTSSPPNYQEIDIFDSIINFLIYIPLSLFRPETLEQLAANVSGNMIAFFAIAGILLIIIAYRLIKKANRREKMILIAGALWFAVFALPATPMLMRWYAFLPSAGIFIIISAFINSDIRRRKYIITLLAIIAIIASSVFALARMNKWQQAGEHTQKALISLRKFDIKSDTLHIWAAPDKINRVNAMKIGFEQAAEWAAVRELEVLSPLRSEIYFGSRMKLDMSAASATYTLNGGRFLPQGGPSTSLPRIEEFSESGEGWQLRIQNYFAGDSSRAVIYFDRNIDSTHFFYINGRFVRGDQYRE